MRSVRLYRRILMLTAVFAPLVLMALPGNDWKAKDGDYDGNYSDPDHWTNGTSDNRGHTIYFKKPAVVNIDVDAIIGFWSVPGQSSIQTPDLSWVGTGSISNTATSTTTLGINRQLTVDGPRLFIDGSLVINTNAVLTHKKGEVYVDKNLILRKDASLVEAGGTWRQAYTCTVKEDASIAVTSGDLTCSGDSLTVEAGGQVTVSGGMLTVSKVLTVASGGQVKLTGGALAVGKNPSFDGDSFLFQGGRLRWYSGSGGDDKFKPVDKPWLLPPAGAVLELPGHSNIASGIMTIADTDAEVSYDGTIVITNRTGGMHPGLQVYKCNATFSGAGTLIADRLNIYSGTTLRFRQQALYLGYGLDAQTSNDSVFDFSEGATIGAWDDWNDDPVGRGYTPSVKLGGAVKFDTLNCLDGETTHTITLRKVVDDGLKSLEVVGGGTVSLKLPSGSADEIRSVKVGANTTLNLSSGSLKIRIRKLTLGAGAKLLMTAGTGGLEIRNYEIDPTAQIVATVPTGLTAAKLYPLIAADDDFPSSVVTLTGDGVDGWTKKTVRGVSYLSDGTDPGPGTASDKEWVGSVSSSWKDGANWYNVTGDGPYGSMHVIFRRDINPFVTNDYSRLPTNGARGLVFGQNGGPFWIENGTYDTIVLTSGSKWTYATVRSSSSFPVEIACFVQCTPTTKSGAVTATPYMGAVDAPVSMIGGGVYMGEMHLQGDVRFGGDWCGGSVTLDARASGGRATQLTVLPGGVFTFTNDVEVMAAPARMTVDGSLDISNIVSTLSAAVWTGSGTVKLHDFSMPAASETFSLQDGLTLYPEQGWPTASAADPAVALTIAASDSPTLGATCDWAYGPATGAEPTTTAEERALTVAKGATLNINTADPSTAAGHTITFKDPIVGAGNVVKQGAGVLRLETGDSSIGGSFTVSGGTIELGADLATAAMTQWTRIFTASSFTGVEAALSSDYQIRSVETAEGLLAYEVRVRPGLMLIVH